MQHVFTRSAEPEDASAFASLAGQNPHFDPAVLSYPTTFTLCAYDKSGVTAYMPVQQPFCMEAIAFRPDTTDTTRAAAMKELTHSLIFSAHAKGCGEIIFLGTNEGTNKYAVHQGFTELPFKVYRVRLAELEGRL